MISFSLYRPDLGYVQGMSYVAGTILMHMHADEFETFRCFCNLMNRDLLFDFYSFDAEKINIFFNLFMKLLREKLPKLHSLFRITNLSCSVFLFEWIVTIFSNIFPLDVAAQLWD